MKSTTYIVEITNHKNEKYLYVGRNPVACSPPCLLASYQPRNFLREFTPIKLRDLSHVLSAAPIFLGIFVYHSFYGMALRF